MRLSDVRCDQKEECKIVQGDIVELVGEEKVRCESDNMSEMIHGDCLEKSGKENVKNVRCAQDKGEEKCHKVRGDRMENVRCCKIAVAGGEIVNLGGNENVKCAQIKCKIECLSRFESGNVQRDQTESVKSDQVTSLIDKIQGDQVCRSRSYTSPTNNITEQDRHSHPNSHTLTTAGENGLLQRDNTVFSTALRGGKSTGPPQGSVDLYTKYQETKPQPHTKHTSPPSTKATTPTSTTTPSTTTHHQLKKNKDKLS